MSYRCGFIHAPDPNYSENQSYGVKFMPVWAFTIAAFIPEDKGYQLFLRDIRFDSVSDIPESDVYFFSGINQDYPTILSTWQALKKRYPHAKSIIGGPICWSFNQANDLDRFKEFDHVFVGDGEGKIAGLLEKLSTNQSLPHIIKNPDRFKIGESRPMFRPFLDETFDRYYGVVVEVSRGCPFLCEFCDVRVMEDNNRSHIKEPDLIVSEVEYSLMKGKTQFILACDNFIGEQGWAEEVVDKLIQMVERTGRQPKIYTWITINVAKMDRLMKKMRQAGFELLFIGVESFNVNSLIETAKVQNTVRALIGDIRNIQSYGFIIVAGLIFGFDTDQEDCYDITLTGLRDSGLLSGDPSFLTALPGTPLYRRMELSNRLRTTSNKMSSTSTGGVKYETNIKYLLPRDLMVNGFKNFVRRYNDGKFQFARIRTYFESLKASGNFVPLKKATAGGFGSFNVVMGMIFKNWKSVKHLFIRVLFFISTPSNIYYGLKGVYYVLWQGKVPGRLNQLQFWLFSWSNYVMKYKYLKGSDIDIESVDPDFDYTKIIPDNYREFATELIPKEKIDAQAKSTIKGLSHVVQRKSSQKSA